MKMASYVNSSIALTLGMLLSFSSYASGPCMEEGTPYSHPLKANLEGGDSSSHQIVSGDTLVLESKTFSKTSLLEDRNDSKKSLFSKAAGKQRKIDKGRPSKPVREIVFRANQHPTLIITNPSMLPMIPGGWQQIR